jgi:hypothetical protein
MVYLVGLHNTLRTLPTGYTKGNDAVVFICVFTYNKDGRVSTQNKKWMTELRVYSS